MSEWWDVVNADGRPAGAVFRRGDEGWPAGSIPIVLVRGAITHIEAEAHRAAAEAVAKLVEAA